MARPATPCSVDQPITEPSEAGKEEHHRPGRVEAHYDVSCYVTAWRDDRNTTLSELVVKPGICKGRNSISRERAKEDEGHGGVGEVVVLFELGSYIRTTFLCGLRTRRFQATQLT